MFKHSAERHFINSVLLVRARGLVPEYDDQESIPEGLSEHYVESNGKWILDLEGQHPAARAKINEFRDNNVKLLKQLEEMNGQLSGLKDVDPKKYREMQEKLRELEDKQLIDAGNLDEVLNTRTERMRSDFESQTKALAERAAKAEKDRDSTRERLTQVLIDNEVTTAVTTVGTVRRGAMEDILARARRSWSLDDDGKPRALNPDGSTRYGKDGQSPMSMSEYAEELSQSAPWLFEGSSGGGGSGSDESNRRRGRGDGKTVNVSDKKAFNANLEEIAKGKVRVINDQ